MKKAAFCICLLYSAVTLAQPNKQGDAAGKIIINGEIPPGFDKKTISISGYPADKITLVTDEIFTLEKQVESNAVRWEIPLQHKPILVYGNFINSPRNVLNYLLEPGDRISIKYKKNGVPSFEGIGAEKFELTHRLLVTFDSLKKKQATLQLSGTHQPVSSTMDYLQWHLFLNKELTTTLTLIDSYRKEISSYAYATIKEAVINEIETRRLIKFKSLIKNSISPADQKGKPKVNQFGLSNQDLCRIFDTTLNGPSANWLQFETPVVSFAFYYYLRSGLDGYRENKAFFKENAADTSVLGEEKVDRYVYQYYHTKKKYSGIIREAALAFYFHFPRGVLRTIGFDPRIETILSDYYAISDYPDYAKAVKEYETILRSKKSDAPEPGFTLIDTNNKEVSKADLQGKVTLIDFWFTGCAGCLQLNPYLKSIEKEFGKNPAVAFVNVSVDKDKSTWLKSLEEKKFTTANGLSLFTGSNGTEHPIIKNYLISSYPSLLLFDAYGRSIPERKLTDPRKDGGKRLIAQMKKQLALMKDGPYVYNNGSAVEINYLNGNKHKQYFSEKSYQKPMQVFFDTDNAFEVTLKNGHQAEPSIFPLPEKLLMLSDIEGNFPALKDLLTANKVINNAFEWTFGKGHLVFAGDMFDRGEQVTECLWLLYSLEEKAKAAGGYVHFILGNHEIMNLQGNNRYTQVKYKQNAALLNRTLKDLHGRSSELGKWLRSKNIVEKIGDILVLHGGVSDQLLESGISIPEINELARTAYDDPLSEQSDPNLRTIMNDRGGIFWNRDYYTLDKSIISERIKKTHNAFNINHIITGHTIVDEEITVHFEGQLFNLDTKHAEGKSEALYIVDNEFYRTNSTGKRILLFKK